MKPFRDVAMHGGDYVSRKGGIRQRRAAAPDIVRYNSDLLAAGDALVPAREQKGVRRDIERPHCGRKEAAYRAVAVQRKRIRPGMAMLHRQEPVGDVQSATQTPQPGVGVFVQHGPGCPVQGQGKPARVHGQGRIRTFHVALRFPDELCRQDHEALYQHDEGYAAVDAGIRLRWWDQSELRRSPRTNPTVLEAMQSLNPFRIQSGCRARRATA